MLGDFLNVIFFLLTDFHSSSDFQFSQPYCNSSRELLAYCQMMIGKCFTFLPKPRYFPALFLYSILRLKQRYPLVDKLSSCLYNGI